LWSAIPVFDCEHGLEMLESPIFRTDIALQFVIELLTIIHLNAVIVGKHAGDSHHAPYGNQIMGQLIKFVPRKSEKTGSYNRSQDGNINANGDQKITKGQLLFFTGVRYERPSALPSRKLKMPFGSL
jgi:hypothetical protein